MIVIRAEIRDNETTEEGRLIDSINNKAIDVQSSIDLEVDGQEYHINSGHETDVQDEKIATNIGRSTRVRKQRMAIESDQIGDCDDPKDLDYK